MAYDFIHETGLIVPDTSQIRDEVIEEFRAIFGSDIDTDPSTPTGLLIAKTVEERDAIARNNAELANQINPSHATGVFLDAILALSGSERRGPTHTQAIGVLLSGARNAVIPAGVLVETDTALTFRLMETVVLSDSPVFASGRGDFVCETPGAIEIGPGDLTTIVTPVPGWSDVGHAQQIVIGSEAEKDAPVRRRRRETLAAQSVSTPEAIRAHLDRTPGVRSFAFRENTEPETRVIDGVSIGPHSIWACVEGGADQDVGLALLSSKSCGAGYSGSVLTTVEEPVSGQPYQVRFDRPVERLIRLRVAVGPWSGGDARSVIPRLIMNYMNQQLDGEPAWVVGVSVSMFEIAAAINAQEPTLNVRSVQWSSEGGTPSKTGLFEVAINEVARTRTDLISVIEDSR